MAPIARRPRTGVCIALALALISAACSLVKPEETPADKQTDAAHSIQEGKHAEAAQSYAQLAQEQPAERDSYELLSAEQWVAAGNLAAAKQAFALVSNEARSRLPVPRALVAAEIAYADNDGARAIHELDQIAVPTAAEQAQNYWWIRGRSAFLTAHPVEGTRALVERERYLTDANDIRANREELFNLVRAAAERGQSQQPPPKSDPIVAGWLDLGPVAVELARDPLRASNALANWQRLYPQHPANVSVLPQAQTQVAADTQFPDQIALLLPLSGRAEASGVAVRDGFIAAYLEQSAAARPRLKVYDVAAEPIAQVYSRAVAEGAGFIVGPLTKEDVAALSPLSAGRTPVLALNFLADSVSPARDFFQFALPPEDEARAVARRVMTDGRAAGVMIVQANELGARIAAAFTDELKQRGGTVLDSQRYDPSQVDFSDLIKQVLQVKGGKGDPVTHRSDAAFVFIAGSPSAARLIMTQLRFHYAGDVPVYATSDSYEPDPSANADIDGMLFPDMPWMIASDSATAQIRDSVRTAWPARTARRDRLYAFGFDAYRLLPMLRARPGAAAGTLAGTLAGVTGQLHVDEHNRVRRELEWAQIKSGAARAL